MKSLHNEIDKINRLGLYEISDIMAGQPDSLAIELTADTERNRMKILCLQLSNGNISQYKELYYETPLFELYELMVLLNAINYREEK